MLGGWILTCPDCADIPANRVFSKPALKEIKDLSVNGRLDVRDLLVYHGKCSGKPGTRP